MNQHKQPYVAVLGVLIVLMIRTHGCAAPHEQVALISLKSTIYNKFMQL